jgi:hypothetical protein
MSLKQMKASCLLIISLLLTACATTSPEKAAAIALVSKNPYALYDLDEKFKSDKDVVLAAVKKDPRSMIYASDSLKRNKEVVLAGVSKIGILILDIGNNNPLYNDPDVVLAAIRDDYPGAMSFASEELKNDSEFVKRAVAVDPQVLCFVNKRFRADLTLMAQMDSSWPCPNLAQ